MPRAIVTVLWDAVDAWFEEDEQMFGHARNPYHRVDCVHSHRKLRVEAAGTTLVDTAETMVVYETALEPRLYVDRRHVRVELAPSQTRTYCPYKGTATYWNGVAIGDVSCQTSRGATRMLSPSPRPCSTW